MEAQRNSPKKQTASTRITGREMPVGVEWGGFSQITKNCLSTYKYTSLLNIPN